MATQRRSTRSKGVSRRRSSGRGLGGQSEEIRELSPIDAEQPDLYARKGSGDQAHWSELEREFREMRFALIPFTVPTERDVEQFRLSQITAGRVESPFLQMIENCQWVYSRDRDRLELLRSISYELALGFEPPALFDPPKHLDWDLIEHSIGQRQLSLKFACEWGKLCNLFGRYLELVHNSKLEVEDFKQAFAGDAGGSRLLHKHWYARWTNTNSHSLLPKDRIKSDEALVGVCYGIVIGRLALPLNYSEDWFGHILAQEEGEYSESLRSFFCDLSAVALKRLLAYGDFDQGVLPPINPEEYMPRVAPPPTPGGRGD
jgi:hypothetical protein